MNFNDHFTRIKDGANSVFTLTNLSAYVEKYIKIDNKPYQFGDRYGFQADIINDTSRVTNTVKPAQIGMTTATMAYTLAGTASQQRFNAIYTLPSANDASKLVTTKLNPLIYGSPELKRLLDTNVDNNELKKIGNNFIFIRGTKSETAALSISADALVADEIDRSDPDTLKQFRSRLQGSQLQIIKQFSTPTVEGLGIAKEAETSKRYRHFGRCVHCNNLWLPSYDTDIVIPNYRGDLENITKSNIKDIEWQKAHWRCPKCGKDPQFHPKNLQWVCENNVDNYEAHTYFISPVTACLVLRPSYLVRTSTEFNTRSEWRNQVLGETSEEANEQIGITDVTSAEVQGDFESSDIHYLGADMGLMCAVSIGKEAPDGTLIVVHREYVPIGNFEKRRLELIGKYRCLISVHDAMPYTTDIMRICNYDNRAYGAIFVQTKGLDLFTVQEKQENNEDGAMNFSLLKLNRTAVLDLVRDKFKERKIIMRKQEDTDRFQEQYTSLKRVQQFKQDELVYVWEKTDGEDHFMFSLVYLQLAIRLRARAGIAINAHSVPFVRSFRVKQAA